MQGQNNSSGKINPQEIEPAGKENYLNSIKYVRNSI
jgi:hypothetical protein